MEILKIEGSDYFDDSQNGHTVNLMKQELIIKLLTKYGGQTRSQLLERKDYNILDKKPLNIR